MKDNNKMLNINVNIEESHSIRLQESHQIWTFNCHGLNTSVEKYTNDNIYWWHIDDTNTNDATYNQTNIF